MVEMYHITMLVSGEQEDAIRSLFRDKQWQCFIQALSNEHLEILKQGGFSDMFSLMETSESHNNNSFKEIKTEVIDEDDHEMSDNQSLNETENSSKVDDSIQNTIASEHTSSNTVDDIDDTMNEEMTDKKADVLKAVKLKPTNTNYKASAQNKQRDNVNKIVAPNPGFMMVYPPVRGQLLDSKGRPVGSIIQPMGSMMPPVGSIIRPMGSMMPPVGSIIQPIGNMAPPLGSIIQPVGNIMQQLSSMTQKGGNIMQKFSNMTEKSGNSQRARRKSKPVQYDPKPDPDNDSDSGPECSVCGERFKTQATLKQHFQQVHVVSSDHGCNYCTERFDTEGELFIHKQMVHGQSETNTQPPARPKKPSHQELIAMGYLECPICHAASRNKKSLRQHMSYVHEGAVTYTCEVCGTGYQNYKEYLQHKKETKHNTSIWMLGTYMCDSCGKMFKRYDKFKEHDTICKNGGIKPEVKKTVPCDECGAMFPSATRLGMHKRVVHTVEPCTCEICGVVKKNRQSLASHRLRHDPKNRKFSCDECNKSFFTPGLLNQHKRVHSKEKPFQCPMCEYRCAAKSNLHKHALGVHKVNLKASSVTETEYSEYSLPVSVAMDLIMQ